MAAGCRILLRRLPLYWRQAGGGRRALCAGGAAPPAFTDPEVQRILAALTGLDLAKVFRPAVQELRPPSYKLLTDAQLAEARDRACETARQRLRPTPVLEPRRPIQDTLAEERLLAFTGETANYIFTDISQGTPDRERFIAVREPGGRLRKASWEERERVLQVYFPREGRRVNPPPIFREENLGQVLARDQHEHLLGLTLAQFEPDSPDYLRVHRRVYQDIEKGGKYQLLRSTRHFGGLAWHLAQSRAIDGLLIDMLQRGLLGDAAGLVQLHNLLHPESPSAREAREPPGAQGAELIRVYMRTDALKAGYIELALQAHGEAASSQSYSAA